MSFPYITQYSSFDEIHSVFLQVDIKYDNEKDIPYVEIENAIKTIVDSYHKKPTGLALLSQKGPGEFRDVIRDVGKHHVVV